jgi:hypothetical protein
MFYKIIPYFILLFLLIITSLIIYILVNIKEAKDTKEATDPVQNNKICLSTNDYNILLDKANHNKNNTTNTNDTNDTVVRDRKVLNDPLYPPLNRSDNKTHTELVNNITNRNMYIRTNDINDTYRLVGYVTNNSQEKDTGNNNWKLFARQKDRNISEFYMKPTDNNNDMKVPITDDIIIGDRLRDIYNIPSQLTFKSPLFNKDPYNVVEVPKADLSRSADYL